MITAGAMTEDSATNTDAKTNANTNASANMNAGARPPRHASSHKMGGPADRTIARWSSLSPTDEVTDVVAQFAGTSSVDTINLCMMLPARADDPAGGEQTCSIVATIIGNETTTVYQISYIQRCAITGRTICYATIKHDQLMRETIWGFCSLEPAEFKALFSSRPTVVAQTGYKCEKVTIRNGSRTCILYVPHHVEPTVKQRHRTEAAPTPPAVAPT